MFAKKNLIAVAALATLAVSAQAQSSVTLYGNVDAGLAYVKVKQAGNSDTTTAVESSILTESFFGLKGQEDLGGGLKAIFKLESFIDVDTGATTAGNFFGKNAYVGLAGDFGTVKLGNQESLFKTEAAAFDAFGVSPVLAVSKLFVDSESWQNTIGYTLA
jgi:predicted porin